MWIKHFLLNLLRYLSKCRNEYIWIQACEYKLVIQIIDLWLSPKIDSEYTFQKFSNWISYEFEKKSMSEDVFPGLSAPPALPWPIDASARPPSSQSHKLFTLLPFARRWKCICATTTILHNGFSHEAVRLLSTELVKHAQTSNPVWINASVQCTLQSLIYL